MTRPKTFQYEIGSALISTLLMIVVLTIIVTAFMQSMAVERRTANSYKNKLQAELAAEAGVARAMQLLTGNGTRTDLHYILSVTNPNTESEVTELHVLAPDSTDIVETTQLVSESGSGEVARIETGASDASGKVYRRGEFVPIKETSPGGGDEIARFAFWIEPENFKQNVKTASRTARTSAPLPSGLPLIKPDGSSLSADETNSIRSLSEPLPTAATINQVVSADPLFDPFNVTTSSPAENLTPEGWKRLNLTRLKTYIDGGAFSADLNGDGTPEVVATYPGLDANQGPTSKRFELIKQLLNEDGSYPFDKEDNPWGPGNLEFIRKRYPTLDTNGAPTEARQTVANLLDYIDADMVPTTDGLPGDAILNANADTSTASNQRTVNVANWEIPAAQIHAAPTVLGVEAKRQSNGTILGHPFLTAATVGLIFNPIGGGPMLNSSRVLGNVLLANPWDADIRWKTTGVTGYVLEMQVKKVGTPVGGSRGNQMHVPGGSQGYFMNAWLAQYSGMLAPQFLTNSISKNSRVLFPRDWAGNFDLANGPFALNQPTNGFQFQNLTSNIELLRLIKRDALGPVPRYLVQDLSVLNSLQRPWTPSSWTPSGGIYKVGQPAYNQSSWHLVTDPRLNFRLDSWKIGPSRNSAPVLAPSPEIPVFTQLDNPDKDLQQGLSNASDWWNAQGKNHFPNAANTDFRPSPGAGEPAMKSYVELGFIATGRPWQTLRLYSEEIDKKTDIPLLSYIDLGDAPPSTTNAFQNTEVDGLINVATPKRASLIALFSEISGVDSAEARTLADAVAALHVRPLERADAIFDQGTIKNNEATDYLKEMLAAQVVPLATLRSRVFTVYSVGEARKAGKTLSRAVLRATVELRAATSNGSVTIQPSVINQTKL
jgi:hypothetical protein